MGWRGDLEERRLAWHSMDRTRFRLTNVYLTRPATQVQRRRRCGSGVVEPAWRL
jgi:hypothetical protein